MKNREWGRNNRKKAQGFQQTVPTERPTDLNHAKLARDVRDECGTRLGAQHLEECAVIPGVHCTLHALVEQWRYTTPECLRVVLCVGALTPVYAPGILGTRHHHHLVRAPA